MFSFCKWLHRNVHFSIGVKCAGTANSGRREERLFFGSLSAQPPVGLRTNRQFLEGEDMKIRLELNSHPLLPFEPIMDAMPGKSFLIAFATGRTEAKNRAGLSSGPAVH